MFDQKEYMAKWAKENSEKVKGQRSSYRKNNKDKIRKQQDKYYLEKQWLKSFYRARQRCNDKNAINYNTYGARGIKFLLSRKEIESLWVRDNAFKMKKPSIDRTKNDEDYVYGNCRFVELSFNIGMRNKIHRFQGGRKCLK